MSKFDLNYINAIIEDLEHNKYRSNSLAGEMLSDWRDEIEMDTASGCTKYYKYEGLDEKGKALAVEKAQDINTDHDWWECMLDQWVTKLTKLGFEGCEIFFSNMYQQGGGASFTCVNINIPKMQTHLEEFVAEEKLQGFEGVVKALPMIVGAYDDDVFAMTIVDKPEVRYDHEHSKTIGLECYSPDPEPIDAYMVHVLSLVDAYRVSLCKEIFSELVTEYEHLISHDEIVSTIEANDYDFYSNGDLK